MLNVVEGGVEMECSGRDRAAEPEGELKLLILVESGVAGRRQRDISIIITKLTLSVCFCQMHYFVPPCYRLQGVGPKHRWY